VAELRRAEVEIVVLEALGRGAFELRTAAGIAAETGLEVEVVRETLESSEAVRRSAVPRLQGREWYAPAERAPSWRERWYVWRAALVGRSL
jgi:hypothetical protein